jgi:glycolate oxidase
MDGERKMKVTQDEFELGSYTHDLAPMPKPMEFIFDTKPWLVVRPISTQEVRKVVRVAFKRKIPLIPRGGASWAMGGSVPVKGGIVVDLTGMNRISDVDKENLWVEVEAGTTWKKLYDEMWSRGYMIGAYPSSAPTATIGGWINVGGVGLCSYKYGGVEQQIRSMEVVLPTGEIIQTGFASVISNQSGYDLTRLFVGSEGTLGIVTKAVVRLHPKPEEIRPLFYSFKDLEDASEAVYKLTRLNFAPLHIGFADGKHFEFLRELGRDAPDVGAGLNIALEGSSSLLDAEEKIIEELISTHRGKKESEEIAKHEWDERFYHFRARRLGPGLVPGDAFIPVARFADAIRGTYDIINKLKMRAAITGSVVERNTVGLMPYYLTDETDLIRSTLSMGFAKKLFDLAFRLEGRPAGGLGLFFSANLQRMLQETPDASVDLMKRIKETLDPHSIMNPGKTVGTLTRWGFSLPAFALNFGMDAMAWAKKILPPDR